MLSNNTRSSKHMACEFIEESLYDTNAEVINIYNNEQDYERMFLDSYELMKDNDFLILEEDYDVLIPSTILKNKIIDNSGTIDEILLKNSNTSFQEIKKSLDNELSRWENMFQLTWMSVPNIEVFTDFENLSQIILEETIILKEEFGFLPMVFYEEFDILSHITTKFEFDSFINQFELYSSINMDYIQLKQFQEFENPSELFHLDKFLITILNLNKYKIECSINFTDYNFLPKKVIEMKTFDFELFDSLPLKNKWETVIPLIEKYEEINLKDFKSRNSESIQSVNQKHNEALFSYEVLPNSSFNNENIIKSNKRHLNDESITSRSHMDYTTPTNNILPSSNNFKRMRRSTIENISLSEQTIVNTQNSFNCGDNTTPSQLTTSRRTQGSEGPFSISFQNGNFLTPSPINTSKLSMVEKRENISQVYHLKDVAPNEIYYQLQDKDIHIMNILKNVADDKIRYLHVKELLGLKFNFYNITMEVLNEISNEDDIISPSVMILKMLVYVRKIFENYGIHASLVSLLKILAKYKSFFNNNEFMKSQLEKCINSLTVHISRKEYDFQSKLSCIRNFLHNRLQLMEKEHVIKPYVFILTRNCYKVVYNHVHQSINDLINIYPKHVTFENALPIFSRFTCAIGLTKSILSALNSEYSQVSLMIDFDYDFYHEEDIETLCQSLNVYYVAVKLNRSNMMDMNYEGAFCSIERDIIKSRKIFSTENLFYFKGITNELAKRNIKLIKRKINCYNKRMPDVILNCRTGLIIETLSNLMDSDVRKTVYLRIYKLLKYQLDILYLIIINTENKLEEEIENIDYFLTNLDHVETGRNPIENMLKEIKSTVRSMNLNVNSSFKIELCWNHERFTEKLFNLICELEDLDLGYDWICEFENKEETSLAAKPFMNPYTAQLLINCEKLKKTVFVSHKNISSMDILRHYLPISVIKCLHNCYEA